METMRVRPFATMALYVALFIAFYLAGGFGLLAMTSAPGATIMAGLLAAISPLTVLKTIPLGVLSLALASGPAIATASKRRAAALGLGFLALGSGAAFAGHLLNDSSVLAYNTARLDVMQIQQDYGQTVRLPHHAPQELTTAELDARLARGATGPEALARARRDADPALALAMAPLGLVLGLALATRDRRRAHQDRGRAIFAVVLALELVRAGAGWAPSPVAAAWLPLVMLVAATATVTAGLMFRQAITRSWPFLALLITERPETSPDTSPNQRTRFERILPPCPASPPSPTARRPCPVPLRRRRRTPWRPRLRLRRTLG